MSDLKALYDRVKTVVDALPQRSVIPDEVADSWINGIIRMDPERAVWHARRAAGIGGSEIGELVLEDAGEPAYLQSAESIIRSKLLLELPLPSTYAMRRGTILEDFVQALYHHRTGATSILNTPDIEKAFQVPNQQHPFMVGNPDDVVKDPHGAIVIPDFKVRGELDWSERLAPTYIMQVHNYGFQLLANAGITPDRYALAELDIPNAVADELMRKLTDPELDETQRQAIMQDMVETVDRLNMPGFGIRITAFDRNPAIEQKMVEVGARFWNDYVMAGKPYQKPGHPREEDVPPEVRVEMQALMNQQFRNRITERVAGEETKKTQDRVAELMEDYSFKSWPLSTPGMTYSQSDKFDARAAADQLALSGVPMDSLLKKKAGKLNLERVQATLESHGLLDDSLYDFPVDTTAVKKAVKNHPEMTEDQFMTQSHRLALSGKKDDKELIANVSKDIQRHVNSFDITKEYPEIYTAPEEDGETANSGPRLA